MREFLIGFCFHEPEAWASHQRGILEDYESSTGVFVEANSAEDALAWGEVIATELLRYSNHDPTLDWKNLGYFCWIEKDPQTSSWKHCLSFFKHVRAGEMPDLTEMGTPAYSRWAEENGIRYGDSGGSKKYSRSMTIIALYGVGLFAWLAWMIRLPDACRKPGSLGYLYPALGLVITAFLAVVFCLDRDARRRAGLPVEPVSRKSAASRNSDTSK